MQNFIQKYKKGYHSIGFIKCPALGGEKVYFNNKGFWHLIRKGRKFRTKSEQLGRLRLIDSAKNIILNSQKSFYKKVNKNLKFWSLNNKNITVILRKIKNSKIHFYSVFDK